MDQQQDTKSTYRRRDIERHKRQQQGTARRRVMFRLLCFISVASSSLHCCVQASGVFELELIKLAGQLSDVATVQQQPTGEQQQQQPETAEQDKLKRVFVCLKEAFTSQPIDGPCTFGNASLFVSSSWSPSSLAPKNQTGRSLQLTNIVRIPITFKWTKSFTIILSVEDANRQAAAGAADDLLLANQLPHRAGQPTTTAANGSHATTTTTATDQEAAPSADRHVLTENEVIPDLEINPSKAWTVRSSRGLKSYLAYRFRLYCAANYYGDGCNTFCRPRDDQFGHYRCSPSGQKVCLEGWLADENGQDNNCLRARCREGCQTGECDAPQTCKCRAGWHGPRCDQCLTYPGCQNGYCLSPGQCLCHANWGGVLCDQDLNYCSTHEPCKSNATCQNVAPNRYRCACPEGYTGLNCELALQASPSAKLPGCAQNLCLNGGTCLAMAYLDADKLVAPSSSSKQTTGRLRPHSRCQCAAGWTGDYCQWPAENPRLMISAPDSDDTPTAIEPSDETKAATDLQLDPSTVDQFATEVTTTTTTIRLQAQSSIGTQDMRHIISGVVVASGVGVFMAALLLAYCCLAALERNSFSFIQMNIIRASSSDCDRHEAGGRGATAFRRVQEKIRNSFRRSTSSKRQIKPETKLSIENVLRPPPSYEESKHPQPADHTIAHCLDLLAADKLYDQTTTKTNHHRVELDIDSSERTNKSNHLVIRGAIEQKLLQATSSNKLLSARRSFSANPPQQQISTKTTTTSHLNCPKHGHLFRRDPSAILSERDLRISRPATRTTTAAAAYPRNTTNTEIVIRAEDLYEDYPR